MKLFALAVAATVGLAVAAPSFAHTGAPHGGTPGKTAVKPPIKKKLAMKMQCAKPVMIRGKMQCPQGAMPKKGEKGATPK